jgi:hypothetical protein
MALGASTWKHLRTKLTKSFRQAAFTCAIEGAIKRCGEQDKFGDLNGFIDRFS